MPEGVDTSSYLKPGLPVSPLDVAGKLGNLQQQKLAISQAQLDQVNQAYTYLVREINSLPADAEHGLTYDKITGAVNNLVRMGLVPQEKAQVMIGQVPKDPKGLAEFRDKIVTTGEVNIPAMNAHYGTSGTVLNGQTATPSRQFLRGAPVPAGAPIQQQPAITTEVPTATGTQQLGPQAPVIPANRLPVQGGFPGQYQDPNAPIVSNRVKTLPVGRIPGVEGPSANFGGDVIAATAEQPTPAIVPRGPVTGRPPAYDIGLKQRAEDQQVGLERLTAIKPAIQAYGMLKGLRSGPGTAPFNNAVAFLKANGIIDIKDENDPTAIYQEVNKKLSQYIQGNGTRSDADLAKKEESSPSVKSQISPALIKLTKDSIILDRVRAAVPNAFEGNDYSQYGNHRSTFPAKIDEKAFGLDLMEPKERQALLDDMKKKQNTFEGKKFWNSLATVKKLGLYNVSGE